MKRKINGLPSFFKTVAQIAAHFSVSQRTATTWRQMDGFPVRTARGFSTEAVEAWHKEHGAKGNPEKELARRKKEAEINMIEARRAVIEGTYLPIDYVRRVFGEMIFAFKVQLATSENRLAPLLSGKSVPDMLTILRDEHRKMLTTLSRDPWPKAA